MVCLIVMDYMFRLFSKIHALSAPFNDALAEKQTRHFFRDALSTPINQHTLSPSQLQFAIFNTLPDWVTTLMKLRNRIVKVFGFKVGLASLKPACDEMEIGTKAGFLTVVEKRDDEIISVADDKHMTFYLSVRKHNGQVIVSTLVNQKTIIGRIYVTGILPFHYIIARTVINNAINAQRI